MFSAMLAPLKSIVSTPASPSSTSLPSPGFQTSVSSPAEPVNVSAPVPPSSVSWMAAGQPRGVHDVGGGEPS